MDGKEGSGSRLFISDEEEKILKGLVETFDSAFSIDDIASAFCKAGRNVELAGEILCKKQGSNSDSNVSGGFDVSFQKPLDTPKCTVLEKSRLATGSSKQWKPKNRPFSIGSVSSVIGKGYFKSKPYVDESGRVSKPVKIEYRVLPMKDEEVNVNSTKDHYLRQDMEDFLFQMLGDGFKLERDMIHEVLSSFGYDMQKVTILQKSLVVYLCTFVMSIQSMDRLLDLSAITLDERKESVFKSSGMSEPISRSESQKTNGYRSNAYNTTNGIESTEHDKTTYDLQREVLADLFDTSKRNEESPKKNFKSVQRSAVSRQVVTEPPKDIDIEDKILVHTQHGSEDAQNGEDKYQLLRQAVREYRSTMKEYYKAAINAYTKDDRVLAGKLLEQGQFFNQKACEADEESCHIILETSNSETQDELSLDLHDLEVKEAIRLLKGHLSSLSGIPSIKYLNVIIETSNEDTSKGSRRRLVLKLLERASIKWTEGGDAGSILIRMDVINRKLLSFKKKEVAP